MDLMTSGAFARASGLSRKALRLYDELDLLRPVRVDPDSGYRLYDPAQLEQARLVAWLRRLGMPLARIRAVSTLPPALAGAELARYWDQVEAQASARDRFTLNVRMHSALRPPTTSRMRMNGDSLSMNGE